MYGLSKELEMYAKESKTPKFTRFEYNSNGDTSKIEYVNVYYNKITKVEEEFKYYELILDYNADGKVEQITQNKFSLPDEYR